MRKNLVFGKTVDEWQKELPIISDMCGLRETLWLNPHKFATKQALEICELSMEDIKDASDRLERFAAYFTVAFPETKTTNGLIESPLVEVPNMKTYLEHENDITIAGSLYAKLDSHLPISGSIKARGGIYEVLKLAEDIAMRAGYITLEDDYGAFAKDEFKELFSKYKVAVGSTGNLGLSIGIISAKLGFSVDVHMSADARQWKKDMLRSKGVTVHEYEADYTAAVEAGKNAAQNDLSCHFVDDENSRTLFLGYSVAALRLKKQLEEKNIIVDSEHPLYVYLPCGVGGGPGGVAFGLYSIFGDDVHCFFAEPTHSCCMMLGMATDKHDKVSVNDFGIDNKTVADGLAVGRPSGFVGKLMKPFIDGCYTVTDERMFKMLTALADVENIKVEPSALSSFFGIALISRDNKYMFSDNSTHIAWATGGNMVPKEEMEKYYNCGK